MGPFINLQNLILKMIARGETLERTATCLCIEAEKLMPGVICSIITVDAAGFLHPLAGPSLPNGYLEALERIQTNLEAGSCGTAAYLHTPVETTDIVTDRLWPSFKHLALPKGLRSYWLSPIPDDHGILIGAFALYFYEHRGPTDVEKLFLEQCLPLCVIAIQNHQRVIEIQRQKFVDALTGLPNRAAFDAALDVLSCDEPGAWALMMVELDNLKITNNTFGYEIGDCLLLNAGKRISEVIYPDQIFRMGGDKFAIILKSRDEKLNINSIAEQIASTLDEPIACDGRGIIPRTTMGGAVLSITERFPQSVRRNADFALCHAQETARGSFVLYCQSIGSSIVAKLDSLRSMSAALQEQRVEAYYQPIVLLDTREVVGLEALCRIRSGKQIISAAAFHQATTDFLVSSELTARMISLVAADIRIWLDMGIPLQHVGINVSSADIYGKVDQVLEEAFKIQAVPLKHVIIEITESVYMGHGNRIVQNKIESMRDKGLRIALDDFGTGFASLTHLLTVPVDIIKIDKTFVDRLMSGDGSAVIIEGVLRIAGKLNIRVVAEGIEEEAQAQQLQALGCTLGQGYLFARPMDRQATTALLLDRAQKTGSVPEGQ